MDKKGAEVMAPSIVRLPYKHEGLTTHVKSRAWWHRPANPVPGGGRNRRMPGSQLTAKPAY